MHLLQRFPMENSEVYRQKLIKCMCKTFSLTVLPAQAAPAKAFLGRSTAMLKQLKENATEVGDYFVLFSACRKCFIYFYFKLPMYSVSCYKLTFSSHLHFIFKVMCGT